MFVEVSLPPDFEKIVDKKVTALFRMDEAGGSVKPTGETKKISNRACTGYERKFWAADQGSRYENRIETLWMTIDVPFDVTLYHSLNAILVDLYRYVAHWDRQLVNDLKRTPGFPMAVYSRFYIKKTVSKAYREVIEITEKKPPVGLYSIPAGYKKKEKLTPHFFNSFPYHGDWGILDQ
ncbi:MAG: hypothetical protein GY950_19980 [bacterium]|nr:hypothetical protein [bacterium]